MPERCTTQSPACTTRWKMSISISPSLIVGTIGRSVPGRPTGDDDRTASSSSGENGTVRMSSTPRSNAWSLVLQVAASGEAQDRQPALLECVRGAKPLEQRRAVVVVHVDHGHVRLPRRQDGLRLGKVARRPNDKQTVIKGQFDEVDFAAGRSCSTNARRGS